LAYRPDRRKKPQGNPQWLTTQVDYHANIANPKAEHFYRSHGVESTAPAFELSQPRDGELMRTRHCIRHFLGACLKTPQGKNLVAPLTLRQDNINLSLHFDCARCEMVIKKFLVLLLNTTMRCANYFGTPHCVICEMTKHMP
jgi:putative protease